MRAGRTIGKKMAWRRISLVSLAANPVPKKFESRSLQKLSPIMVFRKYDAIPTFQKLGTFKSNRGPPHELLPPLKLRALCAVSRIGCCAGRTGDGGRERDSRVGGMEVANAVNPPGGRGHFERPLRL